MALDFSRRFPLMAITQNGDPLGHADQAERLCRAGVRWVQLRMKDAEPKAWLQEARRVASVCKAHGAVCIINDSVDIALEVGADGAHLGRTDLDWAQARRKLGSERILGGTVNYVHEAEKAAHYGCLDYVGIGPLRFTRTKKELAPLQGYEGLRRLLSILEPIPAWAIGGIEVTDVPLIRDLGAAGTAVCSALLRKGAIDANVAAFLQAWPFPSARAESVLT